MTAERLDDPRVFIPDLLANHPRFQPRKEAVVCGDVRRNWGEFDRNISRVANALSAAGIVRGDRIAVLMGSRVCGYTTQASLASTKSIQRSADCLRQVGRAKTGRAKVAVAARLLVDRRLDDLVLPSRCVTTRERPQCVE